VEKEERLAHAITSPTGKNATWRISLPRMHLVYRRIILSGMAASASLFSRPDYFSN
jgi:hypothetical protein